MVTRTLFPLSFCSIIFAFTLSAPPVKAQSVLQQIEREVSDIAIRTRAAVVTIEDAPEPKQSGSRIPVPKVPWEGGEDVFDFKSLEIVPEDTFQQAMEALKQQKSALQKSLSTEQRAELKKQMEALQRQMKQLDMDAKKQKNAREKQDLERRKQVIEAMILRGQTQSKNVLQNLPRSLYTFAPTAPLQWNVFRSPRSGTGFSIGDGYIVTTADVLGGMRSPVIVTADGKRIPGTTVGLYEDLNLGLVKLMEKAELPALSLGDSDSVTVGHFAISVGNLGGQANSATLLMVGALNNNGSNSGSRYYPRLIQVAGTVGEGTSGAPLMDSKGEVIGMIVAVPVTSMPASIFYSQRNRFRFNAPFISNGTQLSPPAQKPAEEGFHQASPVESGIASIEDPPSVPAPPLAEPAAPMQWQIGPSVTSAGFAIPINLLKAAIGDLKAGKKLVRAWIGISPADTTHTFEQNGKVVTESYVTVEAVYPNSPASAQGVQPGDLLTALDGEPLTRAAQVREVSLRLRPGDHLKITLKRPDPKTGTKENREVNLTIQARPENPGEPRK